jgi:hypothetical protein
VTKKLDKPTQHSPSPSPTAKPAKKKLTLDVTDVAEVLERKISP